MKITTFTAHAACGLAVLTTARYGLPRRLRVEPGGTVNAAPEAIPVLVAANTGS